MQTLREVFATEKHRRRLHGLILFCTVFMVYSSGVDQLMFGAVANILYIVEGEISWL